MTRDVRNREGTAYRSAANAAFMETNGFTSHVRRKKPKAGRYPMCFVADAAKSKIRSHVQHVFAEQSHYATMTLVFFACETGHGQIGFIFVDLGVLVVDGGGDRPAELRQ